MRIVVAVTAASFVLGAGAAFAAEEVMASAEEAAKVSEVIGKIGCTAEEIEKESANLFEIDDATCEIGQYDIKVDGAYSIVSITRDE